LGLVDRTGASWNPMLNWLRQLESLAAKDVDCMVERHNHVLLRRVRFLRRLDHRLRPTGSL
jgi:hypothetical protein